MALKRKVIAFALIFAAVVFSSCVNMNIKTSNSETNKTTEIDSKVITESDILATIESVDKMVEGLVESETVSADEHFNLAEKYVKGEGVKQDYQLARDNYEKAANGGNTEAVERMGMLYHMGLGVEKNYNKAAQKGNTRAKAILEQLTLADIMASGK